MTLALTGSDDSGKPKWLCVVLGLAALIPSSIVMIAFLVVIDIILFGLGPPPPKIQKVGLVGPIMLLTGVFAALIPTHFVWSKCFPALRRTIKIHLLMLLVSCMISVVLLSLL